MSRIPKNIEGILTDIGDQSDAYINGYNACFKGNIDNPYLAADDSDEWDDWERGYDEGSEVRNWLDE